MNINLTKGDEKIVFRIEKERAMRKNFIGRQANTTITEMTPMEANRQVNQLLRTGYTRQKTPVIPKA